MSDVKRLLDEAMSTEKHRLEKSGRQMVECSCGQYGGPTSGQSAADAWRAHLIEVAAAAVEAVHV